MRSVLAVLSLLVLVAGLWWFGKGDRPLDPPAASATLADAGPPAATSKLADLSAPAEVERPVERPTARVEAPRPEPEREAAQAEPPVGSARLFGRMMFDDGAPAAGVSLQLRGFTANSERVAEHGLPADWVDVEATTDAGGNFELRFDPPRAYQFILDAHEVGFAPVSWRWSQIEPEADRDLGEVVLVRGGSILVRIERPDGTQAGTDWRVHAAVAHDWHRSRTGDGVDTGRDSARRGGTFDPAREAWIVTDMPPGPVEVAAYTRIANWIKLPRVEVVAGETVECTIPYDGPDNSRRITVITSTRPVYPIAPEVENVMLVGGALTEPLRCERHFGADSHDFPDLEPGLYSVVVDDPNFERFEQAGVSPGTQVNARLRGASAVRVEVVDRATGAPVEGWSLNLRCENVNFGPSEFALVVKGAEAPADGLFDSLVPLDYSLLLEAPGYPPARRSVPGLARGEERLVRFELSKVGGVAGRVLREDGEPATDVEVELYSGAIDDGSVDWWSMWGEAERNRYRLGGVTSDGEGRYRIPTSDGGPLIVRAVGGSALHTLATIEHEAGTEITGVDLEVAAGVTLVGRVLGPEGVSFDGLLLRAGVAAVTPSMDPGMWDVGIDAFLQTEVEESGEFRLGPFDARRLDLALLRGGTMLYYDQTEPEGSGLHRFDIDLLDRWPGTIRFAVTVGGEPLTDGTVTLESTVDQGRLMASTWGKLDGDGQVSIAPPAGTYRARIQSGRHGGWSWETSDSRTVEPLGESDWEIAVPVTRGQLTVVDRATGEPLAHTGVRVLRPRGSGPVTNRRAETDGAGRVTLELSAGDVWLARGKGAPPFFYPDDLAALPRVEWTAAGPTREVIELP